MTPDEWTHWRETFESRLDEGALREAAAWIVDHDFDPDARSPASGLTDDQLSRAWSLGEELLDDRLADVWTVLRLVMPKHEDIYSDFELEPTLSDDDIKAVEHQYDVELPAPYRLFLTYVARGGPGIFSLEHTGDGTWRWDVTMPDSNPDAWYREHLAEPFPWDDAQGARPGRHEDPLFPGSLAIEDRGCATWSILIVTGEHAGQVYPMDEGVHFPEDASPFLSWYRWVVDSYWDY